MLSLEYVAGLFDGEGHVLIVTPGYDRNGDYTPSVWATARKTPCFAVHAGIANTYEPIMHELLRQFGGLINRNEYVTTVLGNPGVKYTWRIHAKMACDFLSAIRPFSIIKREQIDVALELNQHIQDNLHVMKRRSLRELHAPIVAHRYALRARMDALKRPEHNVPPVEDGPNLRSHAG